MNVLVSMRIVENSTYLERRDALSHDWAVFFNKHSMLPILVPNVIEDPDRYFALDPSGLILTGGDDLGLPDHASQRDHTEFALIAGAIARKIPIFGVCRGLQILNIYFGGTLSQLPEKLHVGTHCIKWLDDTSFLVNSFHNQGVVDADLGPALQPIAYSQDGVIEALRHKDLPIIAIQWHPERPNSASDLDAQLINEWKMKCA
jgi:putative glutamine amidotransferase